ncbi:hypothetical protein INR49_013199 [Caranx melampygus]|nr:hypothetical protein INR49_013199 [Caranx melampygus]
MAIRLLIVATVLAGAGGGGVFVLKKSKVPSLCSSYITLLCVGLPTSRFAACLQGNYKLENGSHTSLLAILTLLSSPGGTGTEQASLSTACFAVPLAFKFRAICPSPAESLRYPRGERVLLSLQLLTNRGYQVNLRRFQNQMNDGWSSCLVNRRNWELTELGQ